MRGADGRGDRFITQRDELRMKRPRLNVPETFPRHADLAFSGKLLAGRLRLAPHACQRGGVQVSLIESDAALLDHARHDAWLGGTSADGTHSVAAALRDAVNFRRHPRRR